MKQKYTYELISSIDNIVFYVGKGTERRAYQHKADALNPKYRHRSIHRKIQSIVAKGGYVIYNTYPHETDASALIHEKQLIEQHGRKDCGTGTLCNLTDGGEDGGNRSLISVETTRQKHIGSKRSAESRELMRNTQKRIKHELFEQYGCGASPETREKMSVSRKGKQWSESARNVKRNNPTALPVDIYKYDKSCHNGKGKFIGTFESISAAGTTLGLDISSLWKILNGWTSVAPDGKVRPFKSHRGHTVFYKEL